jgi:hypothetical protein
MNVSIIDSKGDLQEGTGGDFVLGIFPHITIM